MRFTENFSEKTRFLGEVSAKMIASNEEPDMKFVHLGSAIMIFSEIIIDLMLAVNELQQFQEKHEKDEKNKPETLLGPENPICQKTGATLYTNRIGPDPAKPMVETSTDYVSGEESFVNSNDIANYTENTDEPKEKKIDTRENVNQIWSAMENTPYGSTIETSLPALVTIMANIGLMFAMFLDEYSKD